MKKDFDLCQFLGIEEDQGFYFSRSAKLGKQYRIHNNKIQQKERENGWVDSPVEWNQFIATFISETNNQTIKIKWKPKMNECVYIPSLGEDKCQYLAFKWQGTDHQKKMFAQGCVFYNPHRAKVMADCFLNVGENIYNHTNWKDEK